ncbi:MAG TPA: hypothetical protein VK891_09030, partial [Euzebyales bacterium]|nr:hypothetical protein [Euzebyales bacterium]
MSVDTGMAGAEVSAAHELHEPRADRWRYRIGSLLLALLLIAVWEGLPAFGLMSEIVLPRFTDTVAALALLVTSDFFWSNFVVTLNEIIW